MRVNFDADLCGLRFRSTRLAGFVNGYTYVYERKSICKCNLTRSPYASILVSARFRSARRTTRHGRERHEKGTDTL
jgi:hypothetical protein